MWSYYGTKKRLAKYYPKPIYNAIVEPFAGAAQYSLYGDNWKKQVQLFDIYDRVVDVWRYLISSNKKDILNLPDLDEGDTVDSFTQLCQEEKWLIGFCINPASAMPKKTASKRSAWNRLKLEIADNVYKVNHWDVAKIDYRHLANIYATWYIDPPYQFGGQYYRHGNKDINYWDLAEWCKSRQGQVIVCENTKATWMDFKPLVELNGQLHKTTEAIWYKENNES